MKREITFCDCCDEQLDDENPAFVASDKLAGNVGNERHFIFGLQFHAATHTDAPPDLCTTCALRIVESALTPDTDHRGSGDEGGASVHDANAKAPGANGAPPIQSHETNAGAP